MAPASGSLRTLLDGHRGDADVDFILIPGVGTAKPDSWVFSSPTWLLRVLPDNLKSARVLAFDYSVSVGESDVSSQDFLVLGDIFLNALVNARSHIQRDSRPVLGICHSLGGLIFKQALCIAHEQPYRHGSIIGSVAGIIFLGTPHRGATDPDTVTSWLTILGSTANVKKPISLSEHRAASETAMLTQLAYRFEDVNLSAPVLSISESKKTRVSRGILKKENLLLADSKTCTTNSSIETIRSYPLEHAALCHVERATDLDKLALERFIRETLNEAELIVTARIAALDFKHATTSTYSPVQSERNSLSEEPARQNVRGSIARATAGSSDQGFEVIPASTPMQEDPPMKPPVNLPCVILETNDPSRVFFGQQHILDTMQEALEPLRGQSGIRQFALCGLGGMGKTELATEFALRNTAKFEAIFWVRADEPAKLDQCFVDISIKLGLEAAEEANNQIVSRSLVKGWLANPVKGDPKYAEDISSTASGGNDASWLLIFDNADDPKLLGDYWPEGPGSVLVTSRDPLAKRLYSSSTSGLDLKPLSDIDGGTLLLELAGSDVSAEEHAEKIAQEISRDLAGLPLAIAQMAGIIRRQDLTLSEFQSIYEGDEDRIALYNTKYNTSTKAYKHSIATVWAFEKLSPDGKGLLKLMLFMDPDAIQESILYDAAALLFSLSSFTRAKFNEARAELSQSSLIRRDKNKTEVSDHQISVHRLVQDAIRSSMHSKEMIAIFKIMVNLIWQTWPQAMPAPTKPSQLLQHEAVDTRYSTARYPLCAALYPHVLRLKQMWAQVSDCSDSTKIKFAALLNDAAWYKKEKGQYRGFDGFFDLAQSLCESVPGDDSDSVLCSIHFCLGLLYTDTNEPRLGRIHKEANLAKQKTICEGVGPDFVDVRLGNAYTEMALALTQDGDLDKAIEYYEKEMEIREKIGATNKLQSRDANYAMTLMLKGDLELAERVLLDCVRLWESTGSVVTIRIAQVVKSLGNLRYMQKRFDESFEYHKKALQYFIESQGIRSQRAADLRHKIAVHLIRMKRYEEAIGMINAALECWSLNSDLFRPELARTTWLKAKLLQDLGEPLKARLAFKVVRHLRTEMGVSDSKDVRDLTDEDFDCLLEYRSR